MYYGYRNYQGSLLAMAGADRIVCERYAYDPWGKRVKSDDWIVTDTRSSFLTNRGYTGHEHIDWGDQTLINMNGHVYDPYTAMFYSPDPFIQAPGNWLNYNRYAYCLNNLFKYTDPSGEIAWLPFAIAAVVGGVTNWAINGAELSWKGLGYFGVGALGGVAGLAAGGAVGAGVGGFFAGGLNGMVTGATVGFINCFGTSLVAGDDIVTAAHSGLKGMVIGAVSGFVVNGLLQGINSVFQGKGFWTGKDLVDVKPYNAAYQDKSEIQLPNNGRSQLTQMPEENSFTLRTTTTETPNYSIKGQSIKISMQRPDITG